MMDNIFGIAGTALNAQLTRMNATASNLANAGTVAILAEGRDVEINFELDPDLPPRLVGDPAHQTVKCIDLADKVPLAEPAYGRIAGHFADRIGAMRQQHCPCSAAGRCGCRFGARMAASHDDHIKLLCHAASLRQLWDRVKTRERFT